jgi:hypothetical protein
MRQGDLSALKELYYLWKPVYPFLAEHILDLWDRRAGDVLEMGPFCGAIFTVLKELAGDSSGKIAAFPGGIADFYREEAEGLGVRGKITVVYSDTSLGFFEENSFDLVIFRGALFFPLLFTVDYPAIFRVLRTGGTALIGGGFGKSTPPAVLQQVGSPSKKLNLELGKVEIAPGQLEEQIRSGMIPGRVELVSDGGLWIVMRKP